MDQEQFVELYRNASEEIREKVEKIVESHQQSSELREIDFCTDYIIE